MQRIADISSAPSDYEYREVVNGMYWTRPKSRPGWRIIPLVDPLRTILETHVSRSTSNSRRSLRGPERWDEWMNVLFESTQQ